MLGFTEKQIQKNALNAIFFWPIIALIIAIITIESAVCGIIIDPAGKTILFFVGAIVIAGVLMRLATRSNTENQTIKRERM